MFKDIAELISTQATKFKDKKRVSTEQIAINYFSKVLTIKRIHVFSR